MNNSIMIINPYWHHNTWVFDDNNVGLIAEPFVSGIPEIINQVLLSKGYDLERCKEGIIIQFSENKFPGYDIELEWFEEEYGGNWYRTIINTVGYTGWLCPALFKYFSETPKYIYAKFIK